MMQRHNERELDQLFAAYRDAIPDLEPSPEFGANVWRKIEESRPSIWTAVLGLWAPRVAAAGALAAALLTASVWIPQQRERHEAVLNQSYIEALTVDSLDEHDGALWIMAGDRLAAKR
jgi:hypothetical protein